ncbi:MAG: hypothetical protein ACOCUU_01225 [Nanoarchaeota archaeon]
MKERIRYAVVEQGGYSKKIQYVRVGELYRMQESGLIGNILGKDLTRERASRLERDSNAC